MQKWNNKQNQPAGTPFSHWDTVSCIRCIFTVLTPHRAQSWRQSTSDNQVPCCRVWVFLCDCHELSLLASLPVRSTAKILILSLHNCCGLLSRLPLVLFYNMKPQAESSGPPTAEESRKLSVWVLFICFLKYTPHCLQPSRAASFSTMLPHWLIVNLSSPKIPRSYSMIGKYWL